MTNSSIIRLKLLTIFFALLCISFVESRSEVDQTTVQSDVYKEISCEAIQDCGQCSYSELKEVPECRYHAVVSTQLCTYVNQNDINDTYTQLQYTACPDKRAGVMRSIHYFALFIIFGFIGSMYALNRKKYILEHTWFNNLKK